VSLTEDERYTFSSLITLLIECESTLHQYYLDASTATSDPQLATALANFAKSIARSVDSMQRARVETVVEIALEPITNLRLSDLMSSIDRVEIGRTGYGETLMALEGVVSQLYRQASPKLASMSAEIGELLLRLSRDSDERVRELEKSMNR